MTGVEAVSNGVPIFRKPSVVGARRALALIILVLIVLLGGVALLCWAYGITATPPGQEGYQSVLSQIIGATIGRGPFYYVAIAAIVTFRCRRTRASPTSRACFACSPATNSSPSPSSIEGAGSRSRTASSR
jgi:hypothetical protein